jgi:hypothetical protein
MVKEMSEYATLDLNEWKKKEAKKEFSIGSDISCSHAFDRKLVFPQLNSSSHDKIGVCLGEHLQVPWAICL